MPGPSSTKPPVSQATGEFGRRLRSRRTQMGLSQEALAERTSLHWSYISLVERGQKNLTLHNILRLAAVLEVDAGELVSGLPLDDWET